MKHRLVLIIGVIGISLSALAFTVTNTSPADSNTCSLKGTPACPEYPSCCK